MSSVTTDDSCFMYCIIICIMLIDTIILCYLLSIMWIFAVFFIPIMVVLYLLTHQGAVNRFAVVSGLFMGAFFCVFAILFGSGYRVYPASLIGIFFPIFLYEALLPLGILTIITVLCFKDELLVRTGALMPIFLGFFCLYTPFRIFFRSETLSGFTLFVKPMLLFSCVTGVACATKLLVDCFAHRGQVAPGERGEKGMPVLPAVVGACGLACAVAPALAEALWCSGTSLVLWGGLGVLCICSAIFLLVCSHKGKATS